jgi:hypothetical protein
VLAVLSERIERYLGKFRGAIAHANKHHGLWPSAKGDPMGGGAIYDAVRRRTMVGLGLPINLHRFRGAAGSLWSILDPANVRGVKDLLGYTDTGPFWSFPPEPIRAQFGRAIAAVYFLDCSAQLEVLMPPVATSTTGTMHFRSDQTAAPAAFITSISEPEGESDGALTYSCIKPHAPP